MREEERRDRKRFNFAKEKTLCCETPFTKVTAPTADDDEEKRRGRKGNNLIKGNFSVLPFSFASEGGQRKKSYSTVRKIFPPPVNQRKSPPKKRDSSIFPDSYRLVVRARYNRLPTHRWKGLAG